MKRKILLGLTVALVALLLLVAWQAFEKVEPASRIGADLDRGLTFAVRDVAEGNKDALTTN